MFFEDETYKVFIDDMRALLKNEEERNSLQSKLKEHNIPSMIYYPKPLHLQTCYKDLEYKCRLINSENASKCVLSLPMSPWMDECDIIKILKFSTI